MPKIWNKKYDAHIPAGAVYVGRPTKWGNPFSHIPSAMATSAKWQVSTREESIERYDDWLHQRAQDWLRADMQRELRGKDLICWCAPLDCHARIIIKVANLTPFPSKLKLVTVRRRKVTHVA